MTFLGDVFAFFLLRVRLFGLEESFEMGLHGPPRGQGIHRGVRFHLGGVEEQLLPPYQSRLKALLNDPLEEAPEALQTVALPDPGEARVIGQRFVQVVSEKPADAQAVGGHPHELALRADILEEHHQLQAKEDHGVDAGPAAFGVQRAHQLSDEGEIQLLFEAPMIEVVSRDEILQRDVSCGIGAKKRCLTPIMGWDPPRSSHPFAGVAPMHRWSVTAVSVPEKVLPIWYAQEAAKGRCFGGLQAPKAGGV
jgi:hypothetical protein